MLVGNQITYMLKRATQFSRFQFFLLFSKAFFKHFLVKLDLVLEF